MVNMTTPLVIRQNYFEILTHHDKFLILRRSDFPNNP
jgi:hypothetical protein